MIAYVHVGLKGLPVKYLLNIFTTDCQRHTAEMVVVETLWQLHTLTVINSCYHKASITGSYCEASALSWSILLGAHSPLGVFSIVALTEQCHDD